MAAGSAMTVEQAKRIVSTATRLFETGVTAFGIMVALSVAMAWGRGGSLGRSDSVASKDRHSLDS